MQYKNYKQINSRHSYLKYNRMGKNIYIGSLQKQFSVNFGIILRAYGWSNFKNVVKNSLSLMLKKKLTCFHKKLTIMYCYTGTHVR